MGLIAKVGVMRAPECNMSPGLGGSIDQRGQIPQTEKREQFMGLITKVGVIDIGPYQEWVSTQSGSPTSSIYQTFQAMSSCCTILQGSGTHQYTVQSPFYNLGISKFFLSKPKFTCSACVGGGVLTCKGPVSGTWMLENAICLKGRAQASIEQPDF